MEDKLFEMKQNFLSSAIVDISTYIQLADTKVSIIMGSVVALLVGGFTCYEPINNLLTTIKPYSWMGIVITILLIVLLLSVILVFLFGILTIKGHVSDIGYKSKWFINQSTKKYSFDSYKNDIDEMDKKDIIENMTAELYKLNDINRQKSKTMRWVIRAFASSLISALSIILILIINLL